MSKLILRHIRRKVLINTVSPLMIIAFLGSVILPFFPLLSYSIWLGGGVWFISHAYAGMKLFYKIETNPARFIRIFYSSEIKKLGLAALLFILTVKYFPYSLDIGVFFIGYLGAQWMFLIFNHFI